MATIHSCILSLTANKTILVNTASQLVEYDNVIKDTGSWYNTSTKQYKPDVAGYYIVDNTCGLYAAANTTQNRARIYNITTLRSIGGWPSYNDTKIPTTATHDLVYLNGSTDYLQFKVDNYNTTRTVLFASITKATIMGPFTAADGFDAVRVRMSANTTSPTSDDPIDFDTEDFDTNNIYAAKTLTPKKAGWYLVGVSAAIKINNYSTVCKTKIKKNTVDAAVFDGLVGNRGFTTYPTTLSWQYFNGTTDSAQGTIYNDDGGNALYAYPSSTYMYAIGPFVTASNFSAAQVQLTSNQSISSTGVVLALNDEVADTGNNWNSTSKQFVAPADGTYHVNLMALGTFQAGYEWFVYIRKDGSDYRMGRLHSAAARTNTVQAYGAVYLSAGDIVDGWAKQTYASTRLAMASDSETYIQVLGPMEVLGSGGGGGGAIGTNKNRPNSLGVGNGLTPNRLG